MSNELLVSIIMPAYNAEKYIAEAIQSVLDQEYPNFELLIINDGSTDGTEEIIQSFSDSRIHYFKQKNKGVSAARNVGMDHINGEFFCFLDADDLFTLRGISSRINIFNKDASIAFVDGEVLVKDASMAKIIRIWKPSFFGDPLEDLVRITGKSFFGPSWMIRKKGLEDIRFDENLTHCEDLLFNMECARVGRLYVFVKEVIIEHREHVGSVMFDLKSLDQSYNYVGRIIKEWNEIPYDLWRIYRMRTLRIMFLSYLSGKNYISALKRLVR